MSRSTRHSAKVEKTRRAFAKAVDTAGGLSAAAFRLGVSVSMVNMMCTGDRDPGLELAFRIQECFAIPMTEWVDPQTTETVKRFA